MASEIMSDRVLGQPRSEALERETIKRVARHLLPLLMICYFVAFLDPCRPPFFSPSSDSSFLP